MGSFHQKKREVVFISRIEVFQGPKTGSPCSWKLLHRVLFQGCNGLGFGYEAFVVAKTWGQAFTPFRLQMLQIRWAPPHPVIVVY